MKSTPYRIPAIRRRLFLQGTGVVITGLTTPNGMAPQRGALAWAAEDDWPQACLPTRIKVIGAGVCGFEIVTRLMLRRVKGIGFLAGACGRGDAAVGPQWERLCDDARGADLVFVVTDLSRQCGASAAPDIARVASDSGALTIGLVTTPFGGGGMGTGTAVETEIERMTKATDGVVALGHRTEGVFGRVTAEPLGITQITDMAANIVCGLANALHANWPANFDLHDVRQVLRGSRWLHAVSVQDRGPDRARVATLKAAEWLAARICGAQGPLRALVLISTAQNSLKLNEWKFTMNPLRSCLGNDASTVFALSHDDALDDSIRVTVVAG